MIDKLATELREFEKRTRQSPSGIYLGREEHMQLMQEARAFLQHPVSAFETERFMGIPVYRVVEQNHIRIA